jgi:hypothetical protein
MAVDRDARRAYTASYDGRVSALDIDAGTFSVYGASHTNSVVSAAVSQRVHVALPGTIFLFYLPPPAP